MTTLNFIDMQTFIQTVVDGVIENGVSYKSFYIDYCKHKFYGNYEFKSTDVSDIYDEMKANPITIDYDIPQYEDILLSIDSEIQHRHNLEYSKAVFGDFANSVISFIETISDKIDGLAQSVGGVSAEDIKNISDAMVTIKANSNSTDIVKALVENGVISKSGSRAKKKITSTKGGAK